jgi:hypothetical protein
MGIGCGVFIHRTGRYLEIIWIGPILLTIGNGLYILLGVDSSVAMIIGLQVVAGVGAGLLFEAPLIALQALVSQKDTATATSTLGFIRTMATALSIIIAGVVFQNGMQNRAGGLRATGLPTNITDQLTGSSAAANVMLVSTVVDPIQKLAIKEAFAWSIRNMWIMYTCISACGIVASLFVTKQVLSKVHTETRTGIDKETDDVNIQGQR